MESINRSVDIIVQIHDTDPTTTAEMIDWSSHFPQSSRPIYAVPASHLCKVRDYFLEKNWRLLPTRTHFNVMHLCPQTEYDQSIDDYLTTAKNFSTIDHYTNEALFDTVVDRIEQTLIKLRQKGELNDQHYADLQYVHQDSKEFDEIFFVPKLDHGLEPIIIFEKSPTKTIADYLYRMINARYRRLFPSSTELINAFEAYVTHGSVKETTVLACVELEDLDRSVSHYALIQALERFLDDYMIDEETHGLSHKTIIRLADMVLRSQFYRHGHRIYRKTAGGCEQIPFFRLLTDIYLVYLQNDLYDILDMPHEIFYRNKHQLVCTWNASTIVLRFLLGLFIDIRCDMPATITIGTHIQTMNMDIEISNGAIITKPYRSSPMELFRFSYVPGRKMKFYRHQLRSKLIRMVQMCSRSQDFDSEWTILRDYCLLTGFPAEMIDGSMEDFFLEFHRTTYSTWRASMMAIDADSFSYLCHKRTHDDSLDLPLTDDSPKRFRSS